MQTVCHRSHARPFWSTLLNEHAALAVRRPIGGICRVLCLAALCVLSSQAPASSAVDGTALEENMRGESVEVEEGHIQIEVTNIRDGAVFFMDEIVVGVAVEAKAPLLRLEINGMACEVVPETRGQSVARRIHLVPGSNQISIVAEDTAGNTAVKALEVDRELTAIVRGQSRLALAVLDAVRTPGSGLEFPEAQYVAGMLERELNKSERFRLIERRHLPELLRERMRVAASSSMGERLELGQLIPADLSLTLMVRKDAETIEIGAEFMDPESASLVAVVDIAGAARTRSQLQRLIADLALLIVQEFPSLTGTITSVDQNRILVNLGVNKGIRKGMKLIVFTAQEVSDPVTGEVLGSRSIVLAEAVVVRVGENFALAELLEKPESSGEEAEIEVGMFVLTK